jgi:hypothetical protein
VGSGSVGRVATEPSAPLFLRAARWLPWAAFLFLLAVTWNRWMEPFVDTGRELVVPARVAQGERLYRDVEFFHGPLAPWIGAAIEKAAGPSIPARTALALAIAACAVEALRRIARRSIIGASTGSQAAPVAAAIAVALTFFLRPGGWLCHFSFDTAIATAAIFGVLATDPDAREADPIVAVLLFVVLVSRVEMGLVAVAAAAIDRLRPPRRLLLVAGAPLAAGAAVYAIASAGTPYEMLVSHGWLALVRPPQAFQNVYRAFAGLDRPVLRLGELVLAVFLVLLAACVVVLAAAVVERRTPSRGEADGGVLVRLTVHLLLLAGALVFLFPPGSWRETLALFPQIVRVVPPVCLVLLLVRAVGRVAGFGRMAGNARAVVFPRFSDGTLLLAGMFSARVVLAAGHVGPYNAYFLPLPILVAAGLVVRGAERYAPRVGAALPRLAVVGLAVVLEASVISAALRHRLGAWERLDTPVGAVVLPEVEARTARPVLANLGRHLRPGSALTGFPEAGFFVYALSMRNPLPLDQFWPGHLDTAGERRMVEMLEAKPPTALLRINALAVGEGARVFGRDYSPLLGEYVREAWRPVAIYGPNADIRKGAEIGDPDFFIEIRLRAAGTEKK